MTCMGGSHLSLETILPPNSLMMSKLIKVRDFATKIVSGAVPQDRQVIQTAKEFYTDHGLAHLQNVLKRLEQLHNLLPESRKLNSMEIFLLLVAAYCHDLSMFCGREEGEDPHLTREQHHERSAELIQSLVKEKTIDLDQFELPVVKSIVIAHRAIDLNEVKEDHDIGDFKLRTRLLAAFLRIADACDIDHSRAPEAVYRFYQKYIPELSRDHWLKLRIVSGVRFDRYRSSIVVSAIMSGNLKARVFNTKLANTIRKELEEELQTVETVFDFHGIPLFHVELKDYEEDRYVNLLEFAPATNDYVILGVSTIKSLNDSFCERIQSYLTRQAGAALFIHVVPPEGNLFIDSREFVNKSSFHDFEKIVRELPGFTYWKTNESAREKIEVEVREEK
jgi:hypothetical protein